MPDTNIERIFNKLDTLETKINDISEKLAVHCAEEKNEQLTKKETIFIKMKPLIYMIVGALLAYGGRGLDILVTLLEPASKVVK